MGTVVPHSAVFKIDERPSKAQGTSKRAHNQTADQQCKVKFSGMTNTCTIQSFYAQNIKVVRLTISVGNICVEIILLECCLHFWSGGRYFYFLKASTENVKSSKF